MTKPEYVAKLLPHQSLLDEMVRTYHEVYPEENLEVGSTTWEYLNICALNMHTNCYTHPDIRGLVFHPSGIIFDASMRTEFPDFVQNIAKMKPGDLEPKP